MGAHLDRGRSLLAGSQFGPAFGAFLAAIAEHPEDPVAHALAARCLLQGREWRAADSMSKRAVALGPNVALAHAVRAQALWALGDRAGARASAEDGLKIDPDDSDCQDLRRAANAWSALESGEFESARAQFEEASRIHPEDPSMRKGLAMAMKTRYPLYRFLLRYLLWKSRRSPNVQFAIVVGGFLLIRGAIVLAEHDRAWSPWIGPLIVLLGLFVGLNWLADPFFDWLLLGDPESRKVFTESRARDASMIGVLILFGIAVPIAFLAGVLGRAGFAVGEVLYLLLAASWIRKVPERRHRVACSIWFVFTCLAALATHTFAWNLPAKNTSVPPGLGHYAIVVMLSVITMLVACRLRFPVAPRR